MVAADDMLARATKTRWTPERRDACRTRHGAAGRACRVASPHAAPRQSTPMAIYFRAAAPAVHAAASVAVSVSSCTVPPWHCGWSTDAPAANRSACHSELPLPYPANARFEPRATATSSHRCTGAPAPNWC